MTPIVTLTVNPTIDKSCKVDHVVPEAKLRCRDVQLHPGGGGLNVARAIRFLGGDACACWTRGGHTGALLGELLDGEALSHLPIPVAGATRENLIVTDESGAQYRFGMPGPSLDAGETRQIIDAVVGRGEGSWLVLSGSLPPGMDPGFYGEVARAAKGARVVLDTSGEALTRGLGGGVFLVKPNLRELSQLTDRDLRDEPSIAKAARALVAEGRTRWVAVSLGRAGALLVGEEACEFVRAPFVPIKSKVGAGDSMVAGMVLALARDASPAEAIRRGVAAGAAAAMTSGTELCRKEDADRLYRQLEDDERAGRWTTSHPEPE